MCGRGRVPCCIPRAVPRGGPCCGPSCGPCRHPCVRRRSVPARQVRRHARMRACVRRRVLGERSRRQVRVRLMWSGMRRMAGSMRVSRFVCAEPVCVLMRLHVRPSVSQRAEYSWFPSDSCAPLGVQPSARRGHRDSGRITLGDWPHAGNMHPRRPASRRNCAALRGSRGRRTPRMAQRSPTRTPAHVRHGSAAPEGARAFRPRSSRSPAQVQAHTPRCRWRP